MYKVLFLFLLLTTLSFAVEYSEMSTQELLAIVGYEKPENEKKLKQELEARFDSMSPKEKALFQKAYSKK